MVLERDRKLVEAQNRSDSAAVLNLLPELFELCRRWPWCWNATGNWLRRRTDLIVQPYSTCFMNYLNHAGDGHGAGT
jgi:hypothetical protein